eukprot:7759486-Heterocapsa_arctica.AAC.1
MLPLYAVSAAWRIAAQRVPAQPGSHQVEDGRPPSAGSYSGPWGRTLHLLHRVCRHARWTPVWCAYGNADAAVAIRPIGKHVQEPPPPARPSGAAGKQPC